MISGRTWGWMAGRIAAVVAAADALYRWRAPHGSGLDAIRWVVERTFARLHPFKRLRVRYEHRADLRQGLLDLACSIICLRRLRTPC